MINVVLDTSPLGNGHAARGVGMYTRMLFTHLQALSGIEVVERSEQPANWTPDVVHYPYFDLFYSTLPFRHAASAVVTVHDVIPLKYPDFYPSGRRGLLRFQRQKLALKWCEAVITDSLASKKDVETHLGIKEKKIHPIYLAAHPELCEAEETHIRAVKKKYALPSSYILYVGDINYNKNLPQLIKAVKFLPETVHLVCVGRNFYAHDIPEWQWIETQMAMSDVTNRVHFLTDIETHNQDELAALYTGALAYVQPSLYEGFGLPVLEAMQCKTPVVATHTSSLIEVGGEVVVFTEPTAESIAEGVNTVLKYDQKQRSKVIAQAYKWSQTFSWHKTALQTLEVCRQVAKKT